MSPISPPAQFLVDSLATLPKGKALDVAAGAGRNSLYLAEHDFAVHAIDRNSEVLLALQSAARERRLTQVTTALVDLETPPFGEDAFPAETYDVVIVFYYLFRPLFPLLLRTLKPGGMLVYETFLLENYLRHQRPRPKEFCLATNELVTLTQGLSVLHYDEGEGRRSEGKADSFTARLLARKSLVAS
jgi:SAM-dependent methyltransferase